MDIEQQIRLNFLDEAEEHFNAIESNLLGLADTEIDTQKVDIILRAAHSVKGGAAMMGFDILSRVAHRLEDFLKILRVRYAAIRIEAEVETLLLQSSDSLRHIGDLHRQGKEVLESDINQRTQPVLDKLREHLGDLEVADENALLAQDEDIDPAVLIFEEGVDGVLDRFETKLPALEIDELAQELSATAQELIGFGYMASLDPFIQLCESIHQQAATLTSLEIAPFADRALKTWRRSHALVLRGSIEKLPSYLEGYEDVGQQSSISNDTEFEIEQLAADSFSEADFAPASAFELNELQSAFEPDTEDEQEFDPLAASLELSELQSAFDLDISEDSETFDPLAVDSLKLGELQSAFDLDIPEEIPVKIQPEVQNPSPLPKNVSSAEQVEKMVRVPVSQLQQFNTLFEQLVLNRNSINLRVDQLQIAMSLMGQRMLQMERSNTQLQQWYGRASVEGLLSEKEQLVSSSVDTVNQKPNRFDSLEMDRYSDIHLICQEQIETIVQLQEVARDIDLGVQEVHQSVRDLHYTTKSMQGNVTRTQMLPFADAVKRFPRVIRDLNLQFNKKVDLKIVGERTLLDRSVIEALGDPLMHLLRNSFDHGIEDSQTRIAAGKPEAGTITIQASNQGTYSVITLSDDGGGIKLDKIRDRVRQMGVSQSEIAQISEAELLNFIFEPGFSTAQRVTELSGRGVGMDVVKTNLQEVRGDVQVSTEPGQGTTFTLRIPFTLSILRVAIIEQGDIVFAIPANSIRELIPLELESILTSENTKKVDWNQSEIPLIEIEKILTYGRSHKALYLTGEPTINRPMTLVVGNKQSYAALKIARFWNEQESTIRTIESPIPLPPGVISSVVFGDGRVIPLIDPMALIDRGQINSFADDPDLDLPETSNLPTTPTILVVDDSINVRRYLSLTLEKAGYQVEQAKDGQEAVDKLIGGLLVQAVICDLEMPRLNGYGVLEEIKERPEFADLPIAMLTSRSNEKHKKLAMNLGAAAYFSKPYDEKELLNKLSELLQLAME